MSSSGETLCGAISPTTSVASAVIPGCSSSTANYLRSLATDENTCNTLPHVTSASAASGQLNASTTGTGLSNNLQLNRNLVMLRNHLRKNTNNITAGAAAAAAGVVTQSTTIGSGSSTNITTGSSREITKEQ
ncbi:uncharacterized protein LOC119603725 [Lucilia sericata]|uniref:uncharacterized protein LOC119603725 n=1 Tax=Lucilia sericata TaxID=13632 RepID=UPI0018A82660|nr:uncharacterized protein LOC119603725 [Lucilia sericata]